MFRNIVFFVVYFLLFVEKKEKKDNMRVCLYVCMCVNHIQSCSRRTLSLSLSLSNSLSLSSILSHGFPSTYSGSDITRAIPLGEFSQRSDT